MTTIKKLIALAKKARENAYCPYSNHPVGAALVTVSGKVFSGANSETAHYRGTCAEGSAICAMTSAGERQIRTMVVIGPKEGKLLCPPCGDCRQRIREFASEETVIYTLLADGRIGAAHTIHDLLPQSFGPENVMALKKAKAKTKPKSKTKKKK